MIDKRLAAGWARVIGVLLLAGSIGLSTTTISAEDPPADCGSAVGIAFASVEPTGEAAAECAHLATRRLVASGAMAALGTPLLFVRRRP